MRNQSEIPHHRKVPASMKVEAPSQVSEEGKNLSSHFGVVIPQDFPSRFTSRPYPNTPIFFKNKNLSTAMNYSGVFFFSSGTLPLILMCSDSLPSDTSLWIQ